MGLLAYAGGPYSPVNSEEFVANFHRTLPLNVFLCVSVCSCVFHKVGFISYYLDFMRLKHAKHAKHRGENLSLIRVRSHWFMAVFP